MIRSCEKNGPRRTIHEITRNNHESHSCHFAGLRVISWINRFALRLNHPDRFPAEPNSFAAEDVRLQKPTPARRSARRRSAFADDSRREDRAVELPLEQSSAGETTDGFLD